jgi:hypothetical protein
VVGTPLGQSCTSRLMSSGFYYTHKSKRKTSFRFSRRRSSSSSFPMRSQLLYLVLERSFCTWKGTSRYIVLDLSAKLVYSRGGIDQQTTRVKNNNNKLVELSSTPNFLSLSFVGTVNSCWPSKLLHSLSLYLFKPPPRVLNS